MTAARRGGGEVPADPWPSRVAEVLKGRTTATPRDVADGLGDVAGVEVFVARGLGAVMRALGWRSRDGGDTWRRPAPRPAPVKLAGTVPAARRAASRRAECARNNLKRARHLAEASERWSRAELVAIVEELRGEAEALGALAVEGDPCADLYRAEAAALTAAATAVDLVDIVRAHGAPYDMGRALACVAAAREAAAVAVEALGATLFPLSPPRLRHARRRALELAAMRIRTRGLTETSAHDRRRYPERESRRAVNLPHVEVES